MFFWCLIFPETVNVTVVGWSSASLQWESWFIFYEHALMASAPFFSGTIPVALLDHAVPLPTVCLKFNKRHPSPIFSFEDGTGVGMGLSPVVLSNPLFRQEVLQPRKERPIREVIRDRGDGLSSDTHPPRWKPFALGDFVCVQGRFLFLHWYRCPWDILNVTINTIIFPSERQRRIWEVEPKVILFTVTISYWLPPNVMWV